MKSGGFTMSSCDLFGQPRVRAFRLSEDPDEGHLLAFTPGDGESARDVESEVPLDDARSDEFFLEALFHVWRESFAGRPGTARTVDGRGSLVVPRGLIAFTWLGPYGKLATYVGAGFDFWDSAEALDSAFRKWESAMRRWEPESFPPSEKLVFSFARRVADVGFHVMLIPIILSLAQESARFDEESELAWRARVRERPWRPPITRLDPIRWGH